MCFCSVFFTSRKCFRRHAQADLQSCARWAHGGVSKKTSRSRGSSGIKGSKLPKWKQNTTIMTWRCGRRCLCILMLAKNSHESKKKIHSVCSYTGESVCLLLLTYAINARRSSSVCAAFSPIPLKTVKINGVLCFCWGLLVLLFTLAAQTMAVSVFRQLNHLKSCRFMSHGAAYAQPWANL